LPTISPDMRDADVEDLIRRVREAIAPEPLPTAVLYHYTDPAGFLGIVGKRKLYATDARFMNDTRESRHAFDLLVSGQSDDDMRAALDKLKDQDVVMRHGCFFTSVSELPDSLSQWRAYGADGLGFAVGLRASDVGDFHLLRKGDPVDDVEPSLRQPLRIKVIYCNARKEDLLGIVRQFVAASRQNGPSKKNLFAAAQRLMTFFAIAFKHDGFSEEREWRLTWVHGHDPKLREWHREFRPTQRHGLAPYVEWALPTHAIAAVTYGPRNREETLKVIRIFLNQHDCNGQLYASSLSYR